MIHIIKSVIVDSPGIIYRITHIYSQHYQRKNQKYLKWENGKEDFEADFEIFHECIPHIIKLYAKKQGIAFKTLTLSAPFSLLFGCFYYNLINIIFQHKYDKSLFFVQKIRHLPYFLRQVPVY